MVEGLIDLLAEYGPVVGFTALVLIGAAREWWVWGPMYRREREEKEYWREQALSHLGLAEKGAEIAASKIVEAKK